MEEGSSTMSAAMRAVDIIRKKRDGGALTPEEIRQWIRGAVGQEEWAEYQSAALLMAIYFRGMSLEETTALTREMLASGQRFVWAGLSGPVIDKHSTGGVGDKTSLILAPLAAACGVYVPMMSGRGLGHTGGTLDKLEAIPGFRVDLPLSTLTQILRDVGLFLIGPTAAVAPADRVLYALRDVTATVESIPLITASILSKKLAEGIEGLVLDVKCGRGAFMKNREAASALAHTLYEVGSAAGLRLAVVLTAMDAPLGRCVGNALEVREAIEVLHGRGPQDVTLLSVHLAAWMLVLGGVSASLAEAEQLVGQALSSGRGLEVFRRCIAAQGGDPHVVDQPQRLPTAAAVEILRADRRGYVVAIDAECIGQAAMLLGAGRARKEDAVDPAVGIVLLAGIGQLVTKGDGLLEIHYRDPGRLQAAWPLLEQAIRLEESLPTILPNQPLILQQWGETILNSPQQSFSDGDNLLGRN
jgi:pyrimidine-nucleoside phosphorylase